MDIIFYHPTFDTTWWINALAKAIPGANVREWKAGDNAHADYALVWHPPVEMLAGRKLKAVFALGAGVDSILSKLNAHPEMLDASIPLFRLEDTGMGLQMQEYAVSQVLHWFRRFDDYQALKNQAKWQPLSEYTREEFTVGIMGARLESVYTATYRGFESPPSPPYFKKSSYASTGFFFACCTSTGG
jgi:glyoxylate/hydroxypyruvate reductase